MNEPYKPPEHSGSDEIAELRERLKRAEEERDALRDELEQLKTQVNSIW